MHLFTVSSPIKAQIQSQLGHARYGWSVQKGESYPQPGAFDMITVQRFTEPRGTRLRCLTHITSGLVTSRL